MGAVEVEAVMVVVDVRRSKSYFFRVVVLPGHQGAREYYSNSTRYAYSLN